MLGQDGPAWDRTGDLERIRRTYAGYDDAGRGRLWDEANAGYARLSSAIRERLVCEIARSLPPNGGRVLDLGCGTGELIGQLAEPATGLEWVGIDLRPEVIELARERHPDGTFQVASADDVPAPEASFDVVVAQVLFSSLPSGDLERAVVAEIRRLLRPGGWLAWSDIRYENPSNPGVHGMPMARLETLFAGWDTEVATVGLIPPIARRLGPATPMIYPILSAVPFLRSHLVGRLRPPSARHG